MGSFSFAQHQTERKDKKELNFIFKILKIH